LCNHLSLLPRLPSPPAYFYFFHGTGCWFPQSRCPRSLRCSLHRVTQLCRVYSVRFPQSRFSESGDNRSENNENVGDDGACVRQQSTRATSRARRSNKFRSSVSASKMHRVAYMRRYFIVGEVTAAVTISNRPYILAPGAETSLANYAPPPPAARAPSSLFKCLL